MTARNRGTEQIDFGEIKQAEPLTTGRKKSRNDEL